MKANHRKSTSLFIFSLLILAITSFSYALEPPKEPIIRVEAGMHTATITGLATDQENRYLVTSSVDKTVRLWDASNGKLIRVFRPPLDDGDEGKLYAIAISPDGQTIACGGTTGPSWETGSRYPNVKTSSNSTAYLFDVQTGSMLRRGKMLPGTIYYLGFSYDNRYSFGGVKNAFMEFDKNVGDVASKTVQTDGFGARDRTTKSLALSMTTGPWAPKWKGYISDIHTRKTRNGTTNGLIVTLEGSNILLFEMTLKSFGSSLERKAVVRSHSGTQPYLARFSPDGSSIVVGYKDSRRIDIYSADDLSYLYPPDTSGINGGNMMNAAWSPDGRFLYAGGTCKINGKYVIRKWQNAGKGAFEDMPVSAASISHILPLKDGRIVVASAEPALSIIDDQGKKTFYRQSAIADYRLKDGELLVSRDGRAIRFDYEDDGKKTSQFSIVNRSMQSSASKNSFDSLQKTIRSSPGVVVKDWQNSKKPTIELTDYRTSPPQRRDQELSIGDNETSYNLAIAPDESAFLLGTSRYLRLYDGRGNLKWKVSAPEEACAVNISGDSSIAVAAFADGIIRWYRMKDGEELFSLFPHRDKKRWAIWTASGYYDVSEGADELIGWHINQGKDKGALFYPISRFFEQFYKPEVIDAVAMTVQPDRTLIAKLGIKEKVNLKTDLKLPPNVEIVSPKTGDTFDKKTVEVKVAVRDMGGGVDEIRLFHNGKIVSGDDKSIQAILHAKVIEKIFTVKMLEGINRFKASAMSTDKIEGNPSEILVTFKATAEVAKKPAVEAAPKVVAKAEPKPVAEIKVKDISRPEVKAAKKPEPKPEPKLPPRVAILAPKDGDVFDRENIEIKVTAEDMGSGISELRLTHNGKPVSVAQGSVIVAPRGKIIERFAVQLSDGLNHIAVSALSTDRVESAPVKITLSLKETTSETDLHIILIGINKYKNPALNLNYAVQDAVSIRDFFQSAPVRRLFRSVNLYDLLNEQATGSNIRKLLQDFKDKPKLQDTVVLYMASHGDLIESDWYLIPHDVVTPENEDDVRKNGISTKYIHDLLKSFKAQKIFMIIDACKSGGMAVAMAGIRGYEDRKALIRLGRSTGTYILSASTEEQFASEFKELGHGVLTYSMLEGLKGKSGDKTVTVEGLIHYVKNRLPELTEKYRGRPQWPVSWGYGMDFPLVLY